MRAEVLWGDSMPAEHRRAAEPLVAKHGHLLPLWCAHLSIRYSSDGGDTARAVAYMEPEYEYRQCRLIITPNFLTDTPANRERTIIHEFIHAPLAPIRRYLGDLLDTYVEDEYVRKLLFEQYHRLEEGCVQDLTFSIKPPRTRRPA
jgi:hypothetical protein